MGGPNLLGFSFSEWIYKNWVVATFVRALYVTCLGLGKHWCMYACNFTSARRGNGNCFGGELWEREMERWDLDYPVRISDTVCVCVYCIIRHSYTTYRPLFS